MSRAFVLGNGVSRRPVPVERLRYLGTVYGCNALYREFTPDVLVATDRPISEAIQASGYAARNRFYTRKPVANTGAQRVPQDYYGYSSGPIAIAIAAQDGFKRIYLLGFDLGANEQNQFNNIYAGTEFYKNLGSAPTYTGNWIRQMCRIAGDFPRAEFIRVRGPTTADVPEFTKMSNIMDLNLTTFLERLNKQEDL